MVTMVDLILKNAKFIICDESTIIKNGAISIDEGKIVDIGKNSKITNEYKADVIIDAKQKLVMPGLICCHSHLPTCFYRGFAEDLPLMGWLKKIVFPAMGLLNEYNTHLFAFLGCVEMIKSGTTCYLDHHIFPRSLCKAAKDSGLRAVIAARLSESSLSPDATSPEELLKNAKSTFLEWNNKENGRIKVWLGPHAPYSCGPEYLKKILKLAQELNTNIHIHLSETIDEVKLIKKLYKKRPVEHLLDLGLLNSNLLAAHCIWLNDHEIEIFKKSGAKIAHNPKTNMKLASGFCRLTDLLTNGITVGLGTDGVNSNNNLDMFESMKFASLLQKVKTGDPSAISAKTSFKLATLGGAKALGLDKMIGSIKKHKKADLILLDLKSPHFFPVTEKSIISNLVYAAHGDDVDTVVVDGKILMKNKKIKIYKGLGKLFEKAQQEAEKLIHELGEMSVLKF